MPYGTWVSSAGLGLGYSVRVDWGPSSDVRLNPGSTHVLFVPGLAVLYYRGGKRRSRMPQSGRMVLCRSVVIACSRQLRPDLLSINWALALVGVMGNLLNNNRPSVQAKIFR